MDEIRELRALRAATVVLAGLLILVILGNVLWGEPSSSRNVSRLDPDASPFPLLRMGPDLRVVTVDPSANLSTRLLLTSLQGLVNREKVELYLNTAALAGNTTEMLSFLAARYNVSYTVLSTSEALDTYLPMTAGFVNGTVLYDPSRPESINVGTMIAAQRGGVLIGPDLAPSLASRYGLPSLFDYRTSDWAGLDPIRVTDRALRELNPESAETLLAILPPDRWGIRDYLVATKTFVFYLPQGALASPFETAATRRVLDATPRGIPVLGWFDTPTLTEENLFVQMVSRAGKSVVGVQDVPNLSVLTALGRNGPRVQTSTTASVPLEDKTYVVLAVPDGDNVDFVSRRMRELWASPERGTMPIAWSMNPFLADLAPPLLDAYYDTMSPLDRFVAGPSGAGYVYPDYTDPEDLRAHLERSARYATATDLDVVWLLNAFPASEIVYTDASLTAYVDSMRPDGIVLDYADQPRSRDLWMQAGSSSVAPVVRSTHFWTTRENFLGKFEAARAAWDDGPHFVWLTVYTFRFDLADAAALVEELQRRTGNDVVLVTPSQLFDLMREDFLARAAVRVRAASSDWVATAFFATDVRMAERHLADAQALEAAGDSNRAAHAAYLAIEELRSLAVAEAFVLIGLLAGLFIVLAFWIRRPRAAVPTASPGGLRASVFVIAVIGFFFLAVREAALQNFWTYPAILLGVSVAWAAAPLRRYLDRTYPGRAPVVAALFFLVVASLAIRTTVAFPLAVIAVLLALHSVLSREPLPPPLLAVALAIGFAVGFAAPFSLPVMTVLAVVLVAVPSTMPASLRPEPDRPRLPGRWLVGLLLALPLSALFIPSSYSLSLRLDVQGDLLVAVATVLLVLAALSAWSLDRLALRPGAVGATMGSLGLAVVACVGILGARGTLPVSFDVAVMLGALVLAAMSGLRGYTERGGAARDVLGPVVVLLPLTVLFVRMPPIVYSLTLVRLPEAAEYALYTPPILVTTAAVVLASLTWLQGSRSRVEKDYPAEGNGGARGS
jgi:hypothetical protein